MYILPPNYANRITEVYAEKIIAFPFAPKQDFLFSNPKSEPDEALRSVVTSALPVSGQGFERRQLASALSLEP